jgi:hypothetical protein
MTSEQVQSILTTIHTQIDSRPGTILSIKIKSSTAIVTVDWEAFSNVFSGQSIKQVGNQAYKTVGSITYTAINPSETEFVLP